MFDKIKQTINEAGETVKEQLVNLGEAAKEKGYQIIETWISTLPKLEAYGFKTTYFSLSVSLNPTLEFEMQSSAEAFPVGRIEAILAENPGKSPVNFVFSSLRTALNLHRKARIEMIEPLTVKISVRLSPEVRVSFGNSIIQ